MDGTDFANLQRLFHQFCSPRFGQLMVLIFTAVITAGREVLEFSFLNAVIGITTIQSVGQHLKFLSVFQAATGEKHVEIGESAKNKTSENKSHHRNGDAAPLNTFRSAFLDHRGNNGL
jgi:hypothetical protein